MFLQRAAEPGATEAGPLEEDEAPAASAEAISGVDADEAGEDREEAGAETEASPEESGGDDSDSGEGDQPPESGGAGAAGQSAPGDAGEDGAEDAPALQAKCACGGTCERCRAAMQDDDPGSASGGAVQRAAAPGSDAVPPVSLRRVMQGLGGGVPLPSAVSARFAHAFGRSFDDVRVHEATPAAKALGARAFTIGNHVAFAPGEFRPGTPAGDRLIAHELTHVVQQSGGRGAVQGASLSRGAYEAEADRAAETVVRGGRVRAVTPIARKAVQRAGLGDFIEDQAWGFVHDHFPDVEPYLRNPSRIWTSIVDAVGEGIGNLVNRVLGPIRNFHPLDTLKGLFGPLVAAAATAFKTKDCAPFFAAIGQFRAKIAAFTAGPLGALKRKFASIKKTIRGVIRKVTAPIGKLLKKVGGAIYKNMQAMVGRISALFQKAKEWSARAWNWVKEKLGLGGESSSEGIWPWIKRKAGEAWEKAKPRIAPWLGPLKTVATVLLVLSPFGPIVLAIKFGPKIIGWLTSIYNQLRVPERIVAARAAIAGSIPAITRGLARGALMLTGIPLAIEGLRRAATGLHALGGALSGVSVLGFAGDAVKFLATKIEEGVTWVGGPVKNALHKIEAGIKDAGAWLDKVAQGAVKLIGIVANPFGIVGFLAGEIWLAIPQCFKLPILNWILDLLIGLVRAIPVNPLLGPLFPLFLHAVIGFLQRVRGGDNSDEKVRVSDRLARLATGSASFVLGLLWGIVKGVGEGLLMPFTLLYDVITAIPKIVDFVNSLPSRIINAIGNVAQGVADAAQSAIDGFWPAVRSALRSPGGGILEWLGKAWAALTGAAEGVGGAVAGALIGFIMLSDFDLGEKLGWVAGTVLFELVLAYISGGASVLLKSASVPLRMLGKVLRVLVKAHEIMNQVFGLVFKALEPALSGIKALVKDLLPELEAGLTAILKKFEELIGAAKTAGEEFAGRFAGEEALSAARGLEGGAAALATGGEGAVTREGGGTAADTAGGAAREHPPGEVDVPATDTPPTRATDDAGAGAADRPRTADGTPAGEGRAAETDTAAAKTRDEGVAASGRQEHISQAQADAEMEFLGDNPHIIEGTPPNRRATVGEHQWRENPSGGWCRYSGDPTQCRISGPPGIAEATVDAAAIERRLGALEEVPLPKRLREQFQEAAAAVRAKAATDPEAAEAMLEALEAKLQKRGADLGADTEARDLLQGPKADEYDLPSPKEVPREDQLSPLDQPLGAPPTEAQAKGLVGEGRHPQEVVPRHPRRASEIYPNATLADLREQLLRGDITLEEFARMFPEEGVRQVFLPTPSGGRWIDHMYLEGETVVLRESKNVSIFRLGEDYGLQLRKDFEIVRILGGGNARVEWRISGHIDAEALDNLRQLAAVSEGRFTFVLDAPGPYGYAGGRYVVPSGVPEVTTIQRAVDGALDAPATAEPAYAAAHFGVEGASEPLPYLDRIQAAFGGHDLSEVRTQTGGPAAEANEGLGSRAYAMGDRVAFSSAPDLRLAAHEAAHVVQQRSGVQLEGGIDRPGDPYEKQADRVADAVVRGESAGPLVAPMAEKRGPSPVTPARRGAIQRKDETPLDETTIAVAVARIVMAIGANDVESAVAPLRDRSLEERIVIRERVLAAINVKLERWFAALTRGEVSGTAAFVLSAFGSPALATIARTPPPTSKAAEEGLRRIWRAAPLIDRLEVYDEGVREIEQAQLDVIRGASHDERVQARAPANRDRLNKVFENMDAREEYDARKLLDPDRKYALETATRMLDRNDDQVLFDAILDLDSRDRLVFVQRDHFRTLYRRLWSWQLPMLSNMARGTEPEALIQRLRLAGGDEEVVSSVMDRAVELLKERRELRAVVGTLSGEARVEADKRLAALESLDRLLSFERISGGGLRKPTFLGLVSSARDNPASFANDAARLAEFTRDTAHARRFAFETAKQRILLADGDTEAMELAVLQLHAPRLQTAPGAPPPTEGQQHAEDVTLRKELLMDPDVQRIVGRIANYGPRQHVIGAVEGDRYNEILIQLNDAINGGRYGEVFHHTFTIAKRPDWNARLRASGDDQRAIAAANAFNHVPHRPRQIMYSILDTPNHLPLFDILDFVSNEGQLKIVLDDIGEADRAKLRLGWYLREHPRIGPPTEEEVAAIELYDGVKKRLGDSQTSIVGSFDESGYQTVMSVALGSEPTAEEQSTPVGRYRAALLWYEQQQARLDLDRGMSADFTETDETMVAAAREYAAIWVHIKDSSTLSLIDFYALASLQQQFEGRSREFTEASNAISELAATIAATVAGIIVVVATGGVASGPVIALAAAAGGTARVVTREMFGADYYHAMSSDSARDFLLGSVDGALTIVSAGLAARGAQLVGLGGSALTTQAARIAGEVAEEAAQPLGRRVLASSVESAIDGAFSGSVTEAFGAMTDERTWRRGIMDGLVRVGAAALLGGLTGAAGGAVMGGLMPVVGHAGSRLWKALARRGVESTIERAGMREALRLAREAAAAGDVKGVNALLADLEVNLADDEVKWLREHLADELRNKLHRPPGTKLPDRNSEAARLLDETSTKRIPRSEKHLQAELDVVRKSEPQPSREPGFIDEVDLGNGHTWRRRPDGKWCRFSDKTLCGTDILEGPAMSEAAKRQVRIEAAKAKLEQESIRYQEVLEEHRQFNDMVDRLSARQAAGEHIDLTALTPAEQKLITGISSEDVADLTFAEVKALREGKVVSKGQTKIKHPSEVEIQAGLAAKDVRDAEAALADVRQSHYDKLRKRSPSQALRDKIVGTRKIDYLTKARAFSGEVELDHIVPLRDIADMPGFQRLDFEEQVRIANYEDNLKPVDALVNSHRQNKSWRAQFEYRNKYTQGQLDAIIQHEDDMRIAIQKEIDKMLTASGKPIGPP